MNIGSRGSLVSGVTVVSMDENIGVVENAQLLVRGGRILALQGTAGPEDEFVDCRGLIAVPGFVNAHLHTWQTALRGLASNWTLPEYFARMHAGLATRFTPDDISVATYAGAMGQLNAGTTTLVDWCHNNPSSEHTDSAVAALERSGIRAAFFHGSPKPDPAPGAKPYWEVAHPRLEVERLLAQPRFRAGGLMQLGLAILGPHYSTLDVALQDFRLANDTGLTVSMHQGGGAARAPGAWERLERERLLGPRVNIVHGNDLTDEQLDRFVAAGVSFSLTPENEMTQGHGHPITGRLRQRGVAPSIGSDLEAGASGEMLTAARIALAHQRALDNAAFRRAAKPDTSPIPQTSTVTTYEALRWVTVEGARMLGRLDDIGTLTPGKQADLVLIDARELNMQPLHDPVNAVVAHASLGNVHSVMVAGRWRKRAGKLVDDNGQPLQPDSWLSPLRESAQRLTASQPTH